MGKRTRAIIFAVLLMGETLTAHAQPAFLLEGDGDGLFPWVVVDAGRYARLHADSSAPEPVQVRYRLPGQDEDQVVRIEGALLYPLDRHDHDTAGRVAGWGAFDDAVIDSGGNVQVDPPIDRDGFQLYSTVRHAFRGKTFPAGPRELRAARGLLQPLLSKHGVPRHAWKAVLAGSAVTSLSVGKGAPRVLVITGETGVPDRRRDHGDMEQVFGYLIIAEQGRTGYRSVTTRVHYGGAVCGVTRWTLVGQADLDADGSDELLVQAWGWESTGLGILRRAGGSWRSALETDFSAPGC